MNKLTLVFIFMCIFTSFIRAEDGDLVIIDDDKDVEILEEREEVKMDEIVFEPVLLEPEKTSFFVFALKNKVYNGGSHIFATNNGDILRVKEKDNNWYYVLDKNDDNLISIPKEDTLKIKDMKDVKDFKERVEKSVKVNKIVGFLYKQLGKPYVYGATGPYNYDCSGLTLRAYQQIGITLPRVALSQSYVGNSVNLNDLRVGDLLYFKNGFQGHTGVYIGGNLMIHAPTAGDVVRIQPINMVPGFIRARRHI